MAKRSSNTAGYSRGEETRARILGVAICMFGTFGFESVTTRMIAAEAAVPAPSLRYYFDSKEGLYVACLNDVRSQVMAAMEPALKFAERILDDKNADRTMLIEAYCELQTAYFDHMFTRNDSVSISHFIARHDLATSISGKRMPVGDGSPAFRMVSCFTRIIMSIGGDALDWQSALLVAGMVNGQIEHLLAKRTGLAQVGIDLTGERLNWVRRTIRQQTIAALMLHSA